jgi:hypothetical protein
LSWVKKPLHCLKPFFTTLPGTTRHHLHPSVRDITVALRGGLSFCSCTTLATGIFRRGIYSLCIPVWASEKAMDMVAAPLWSLDILVYAFGRIVPVIASSLAARSAAGWRSDQYHYPQCQEWGLFLPLNTVFAGDVAIYSQSLLPYFAHLGFNRGSR